MMDITRTRPYPTTGVTAHEVMDEMVLYLPEREKMLSLNSSARAIWELCNGAYTVAQISRILADDLEAANAPAPLDLMADVKTAVSQFHTLGFVTLQEDEADEA